MRKELGKWLLDIAKYIATAVILSSVFGEVETWVIYVGGGLAVLIALVCGLYLTSEKPLKLPRNDNQKKSKSE